MPPKNSSEYAMWLTMPKETVKLGDEVKDDSSESDPVDAPDHYAGDGEVDCMRAMRSMAAGYDSAEVPSEVSYWCLTAIKYVWRAPLKHGAEDVRKARRCLEYALEAMGEGE